MANNRIWLVHRETGLAIMLGKHMGIGWYRAPKRKRLQKYYDYLDEITDNPEDLILVIEDATYAPCLTDKWKYGDKVNGFHTIILLDEELKGKKSRPRKWGRRRLWLKRLKRALKSCQERLEGETITD